MILAGIWAAISAASVEAKIFGVAVGFLLGWSLAVLYCGGRRK